MVRFAVHLFLWTEVFDEAALPLIKKAKEIGYEGVEVPLIHLDPLTPSLLKKAKKELEKNDMGCVGSTGLPLDRDITSSDEATRARGIEYLKRCVEIVSELGSDALTGSLYAAWGKTGKARTEEEWQNSITALKEVCRYAKNYGVTLAFEPLNRYSTSFLNTAADAIKLVKEIGEPNAKIHLDTYHMNIEEKSFYNAIKEVNGLLYHMQCIENDRGIPGTGHVDWDGVFKALSEIGYNRWLSIEQTPTAKWRQLATVSSPDILASEGLKFLKRMAQKYFKD
jgi:D-psicose/D-tagatose/L-ribulose 3-epimerase